MAEHAACNASWGQGVRGTRRSCCLPPRRIVLRAAWHALRGIRTRTFRAAAAARKVSIAKELLMSQEFEQRFGACPTRRGVVQGGIGLAVGLAVARAPSLAQAAGGFPSVVGANTGHPNPQMQAVLDQLAALHPLPIPMLTPAQARQQSSTTDALQGVMAARGKAPAVEPVGTVSHILIPGPAGTILARVYTPGGSGPFPVLVYFHGGGWVIASLDTYDPSCRALTNAAGCIVVSVAYRQAPEHRFPAAPQDAYAALRWVQANAASIGGDPKRVAIGGESAGGNLAAVTCLMARDKGTPQPVHQMLVYPITNNNFNTSSYLQQAHAMPLSRPLMMWFFTYYLRTPVDGLNPYVSPLRAPSLQGLPSATVITDQFDPLRSEGEAYARRLRDAGVQVQATRYNGVTHEFFTMSAVVDASRQAVAEAAAGLKSAFM